MNTKPVSSPSLRMGVYVLLVTFSALASFFYSARTDGVFACQVPASADKQFLSFCNSTKFGDYDHGAFWFDTEPDAVQTAVDADVLFLGNSRMQLALSTGQLGEWFGQTSTDFYLLGFSHSETFRFFRPLLDRLQPSAQMYVVNIDNFFEDRLTGPADSVMHNPESPNRYAQKRRWLGLHRTLCGTLTSICGNERSFIRTRSTGEWVFQGADFLAENDYSDQLIMVDQTVDAGMVDQIVPLAREFLASLEAEPGCIVLANIPNFDTSHGTGMEVSRRLGLPLVAPQVDGLETFDGSHLTPDSAARWATAFVAEFSSHVQTCSDSGAFE